MTLDGCVETDKGVDFDGRTPAEIMRPRSLTGERTLGVMTRIVRPILEGGAQTGNQFGFSENIPDGFGGFGTTDNMAKAVNGIRALAAAAVTKALG